MSIYIIYHDNASSVKANELCTLWQKENVAVYPILVSKNSILFENQIFDELKKRKDEWQHKDYVGITSYSMMDKLKNFSKQEIQLKWGKILGHLKSEDIDVASIYNVNFKKKEHPISLIESTVFQHGLNFIKAWENILFAMNYNKADIYDKDVKGFLCNWWVAKPTRMQEYIDFFDKVNSHVNKSKLAKQLVMENSFYESGHLSKTDLIEQFNIPHYPLYPFILERLPCFFFHHKKVKLLNLISVNLNLH